MGNCVSSTKGINMVWFTLAIIYPRTPRLLMFASFALNVPTGLIKYKQRRSVTKPLVPSGHANSSNVLAKILRSKRRSPYESANRFAPPVRDFSQWKGITL